MKYLIFGLTVIIGCSSSNDNLISIKDGVEYRFHTEHADGVTADAKIYLDTIQIGEVISLTEEGGLDILIEAIIDKKYQYFYNEKKILFIETPGLIGNEGRYFSIGNNHLNSNVYELIFERESSKLIKEGYIDTAQTEVEMALEGFKIYSETMDSINNSENK